jgi:hypothetical protein
VKAHGLFNGLAKRVFITDDSLKTRSLSAAM